MSRYFQLNGIYGETEDGFVKVTERKTEGITDPRTSYRIAKPNPKPSRRVYCREAGDETIRRHIRAGDEWDDWIVIQELIKKGALQQV